MKKSEACAAQAELAKSKSSASSTLDAPIQLTPEQLEIVAAGMVASGGSSGGTTGFYPRIKPL